jgi:hypothetical protein
MAEEERDTKNKEQDDDRTTEDDTVICGTCGQVVGKSWIGTHRFIVHGIERRQKPEDDKNPRTPRKKTPADGGGEPKEEPTKRKTSVYFGDR